MACLFNDFCYCISLWVGFWATPPSQASHWLHEPGVLRLGTQYKCRRLMRGAWQLLVICTLCSTRARLKYTSRRNIGSICIPCEAAPGKKNMCTLYRYKRRSNVPNYNLKMVTDISTSDMRCRDEIVAFDHSHGSMFETKNDNIDNYVGGLVESTKCQVVDASLPVANTNGHVSTKTQYKCPGESCSDFGDCYYFGQEGKTQCTSGRCVRTWTAISNAGFPSWIHSVRSCWYYNRKIMRLWWAWKKKGILEVNRHS